MAALDKSVSRAKCDDRRIVKLEFFREPADVELERDPKADRDVGPGKDPLHKDDDDLLKDHQKTRPSKETPDGVGKPFEDPDRPPHHAVAPKADDGQDQEGGETEKEELDRSAVIDEPHDGFFVRPIQPSGRIGDRPACIVEGHRDIAEKPPEPVQQNGEKAARGRVFFHAVTPTWPVSTVSCPIHWAL